MACYPVTWQRSNNLNCGDEHKINKKWLFFMTTTIVTPFFLRNHNNT